MPTRPCSPDADGVRTFTLLDVRANPLSVEQMIALTGRAIARGERRVVGNVNLHAVYLRHRDDAVQAFLRRADWMHVDGMPVVWLARGLGWRLTRADRVTWVDFIDPLMAAAAREGWRVFHLGSRPGVGERAGSRLRRDHPGLEVATHHGFFDASPGHPENEAVLDAIARFQPHVVLVGMSMPRQERWIVENLDRLPANAVYTCGACFEYLAGAIPTPPRWAGVAGIEWAFRLRAEPRKLWKRYLVEPWFLLPLYVREWTRGAGSAR